MKKSKIRKKNSKEEPSIHLSIILAQFSIFTSFIMNIPLLFKRKKEKERKGVDIWWKKKACVYLLILFLSLPPFHLSKLDTTIEERRESVPPHPAFWNLEVAGDPSLRFIVKIVTSTRIFSSGGDNTVIIPLPPLFRQIDRRTDGRTDRENSSLIPTQLGVVHFDLHLCFRSSRVDRAEILYFRQIYFHPQWTRETRGLFIRRTFLILVNDLREKFISIHRCSKEIEGWSSISILYFHYSGKLRLKEKDNNSRINIGSYRWYDWWRNYLKGFRIFILMNERNKRMELFIRQFPYLILANNLIWKIYFHLPLFERNRRMELFLIFLILVFWQIGY